MNILNLYAGLCGNRSLWEGRHTITSVEKDPEIANIYAKRFPKDELIIGDVDEYIRSKQVDLDSFDFIWASPPCQTHSQMQNFNPNRETRSPVPRMDQIYGLMVWLGYHFRHYYIIENVIPYYKVPLPHTVRLDRHLFWSNFPIQKTEQFTLKGSNPHAKIGGVMRDDNHSSVKEFADYCGLSDVFDDLVAISHRNRRLRTLVRNTIPGGIGKYILEQLLLYDDCYRNPTKLTDFT